MQAAQTPKNKKSILIVVIISVIVLLTASYGILAYTQNMWPFKNSIENSSDTKSQEETDKLNASDPTYPTDKNEGLIENETPPKTEDSNTNGKTSVQVGISSAGKFNNTIEVRSFVSGVIEGNGTCTATFTKGSETLTKSTTAFIDTHTTQCQPITFEAAGFSAGTWNLVVTYESNTHSGKSNPMEVNL